MKLVEEKPFSGMSHENPYDHARDFEQLCSTQGKIGATQDVLKRNLFLFSLSGEARTWYHCFGCNHLRWGELRASFCTRFFPVRRVVSLRMAILNFKQREKETLGMAWHRFASLIETCPILGLPDHVLL